jgi:hypothetical protein
MNFEAKTSAQRPGRYDKVSPVDYQLIAHRSGIFQHNFFIFQLESN